jgi:hypothetical protein
MLLAASEEDDCGLPFGTRLEGCSGRGAYACYPFVKNEFDERRFVQREFLPS